MLQALRLCFENSLLTKRRLLPEQPMGRIWYYRKGALEAKRKAVGMLDASDMVPRLW